MTDRRELDRSRPPVAGEARLFSFPRISRQRIRGGLELVLAPLDHLSMVSLELVSPAGAERDPAGAAGLAYLTGELLDEGTQTASAVDIALAADRLGRSLSTGAGWHTGYLAQQVLSRHLDSALELMAGVMTSASFPDSELERLRREQEVDLLQRQDRPSLLANDRLQRELYGDSPYGSPIAGTAASVRSLRRDQVQNFYRRHYRPAHTALLAAGDFDPDRLAALADKVLGGPEEPPVAAPPEIVPRPREGRTVHLIDRPGASQTELRMGHASLSRNDPDFVPFSVLNVLLGGKFTSRINLNLRERRGFTYGASSRLTPRRGPAPFVVSTAVATESAGAAVREVLHEMERIQQEEVTEDELEDARSYLMGVFPYTLQTLEGIVQRLENLVLYDLPDDYYDGYPDLVRAVDRATVLKMARRHLQPDRLAVVAAGPTEILRPQLEQLGAEVQAASYASEAAP